MLPGTYKRKGTLVKSMQGIALTSLLYLFNVGVVNPAVVVVCLLVLVASGRLLLLLGLALVVVVSRLLLVVGGGHFHTALR